MRNRIIMIRGIPNRMGKLALGLSIGSPSFHSVNSFKKRIYKGRERRAWFNPQSQLGSFSLIWRLRGAPHTLGHLLEAFHRKTSPRKEQARSSPETQNGLRYSFAQEVAE
jgi:hypothetical protein